MLRPARLQQRRPRRCEGDRAKRVIAAFEPLDYLVAPSGSCTGMIRKHYPELLADDPEWAARAEALAAKIL